VLNIHTYYTDILHIL